MGDESEISPTGQKLFFDEHPRIFGVVLLAIAIIFALWAFYLPIQDALQGAPKITLYPRRSMPASSLRFLASSASSSARTPTRWL